MFVNGEKVVDHDDFTTAGVADLTKILKPGKNVLAAECTNGGGPAAFILQLSIELRDGTKLDILSDTSWVGSPTESGGWKTADFDAKEWKQVVDLGERGVAPWGDVELFGPPPEATPITDIVTLPGFQVERLYSVPMLSQGSWVSMTPDPKGRLIVSDQYGGLFRVTPGKSEEDTLVEELEVPIGQAQGLLYAFDSLYVVVNGKAAKGSGLYRLRDTDDDDQFDTIELLKSIQGAGEHGPHAVRLGPDGMLLRLRRQSHQTAYGLRSALPLPALGGRPVAQAEPRRRRPRHRRNGPRRLGLPHRSGRQELGDDFVRIPQ